MSKYENHFLTAYIKAFGWHFTRGSGKLILVFGGLLFATATMAQRVAHDFDNSGYRHIDTYMTRVLTPQGSKWPISISMNYYEGFSNKYYLRLYSRYRLSKKDELILTLSEGKEMHLYAYDSNSMHWNLGASFLKEVPIYDAIYPLDEQQLNDLLSLSVTDVNIGSSNEWHVKHFKNDKIGKWLKKNHKAIRKRLAKSREQ